MRKTIIATISTFALTACVGSGPSLSVEDGGDGRFSGSSSGFTADEISVRVGNEVCGGTPPRDLSLRSGPDGTAFSGVC